MTRRASRIFWTVLLLGVPILVVVAFAIGETLSWSEGETLSRYSWNLHVSWPPFWPIVTYITGSVQWGFLVHVLWHWNPEDPNDRRG